MRRVIANVWFTLSVLLLIGTITLWIDSLQSGASAAFHIYRPLPPDRPYRTILLLQWRQAGVGFQTGWLVRSPPADDPRLPAQGVRMRVEVPGRMRGTSAFDRYVEHNGGLHFGFHASTALSNTPLSSARYVYLSLPWWLLVVLLGFYPVQRIRHDLQRDRWRRAGRCVECGYDLRASPERCPECGAAITATDSPVTVQTPPTSLT